MTRITLPAAVALVVAVASTSLAATFEIDPAHTSVQFAVRHLMVSTVRGTLGKVAGTLTLDEQDPTKSAVVVNGLDTREPKRDAHLKSPDFLDAAKYPTITFKSKRVTSAGAGKFQAVGDLTIRDVTREVTLDVEGAPQPFKDPFGNLKLGGSAHTKINRKDFGITWNKSLDGGGVLVGDDIDVTIDVELAQKSADAK